MSRRLAVAALLALTIALPLHAEFGDVARAIASQRGVHTVWIPFIGLARAVVWMVHPEGVHDFELVTFSGAERVDPHLLHGLMREKIGHGYTPLVRTWSRRSREWSFIYARPSGQGDRIDLVVLAHDQEDTVLVRVDVDADVVARELGRHPREVAKLARE